MSVLSSSNYTNITQAIALLKARIDQENQQQQSKFELITIKVKLIEQQTLETKEYINKYESETNSKVDSLSQSIKSTLKELIENHPSNAGLDQLENQIKQLQSSRDKLLRSVKAMNSQTAQKVEAQIDQLQNKIDFMSQEHKKQMKTVENELKRQISLTSTKLKENQQLLEDNQAVESLQILSSKISKEISSIRERRIERKQNFLNLLETIIMKCKQDSQQQ